jgi:hypothetical protein
VVVKIALPVDQCDRPNWLAFPIPALLHSYNGLRLEGCACCLGDDPLEVVRAVVLSYDLYLLAFFAGGSGRRNREGNPSAASIGCGIRSLAKLFSQDISVRLPSDSWEPHNVKFWKRAAANRASEHCRQAGCAKYSKTGGTSRKMAIKLASSSKNQPSTARSHRVTRKGLKSLQASGEPGHGKKAVVQKTPMGKRRST